MVDSFNYAFRKGELSISQRQGIIRLIPKKDKNLSYLKNWRPISLLNTDYKIATKALAMRLKKVLPNIINNAQTGYLPGRFIVENIRLISDILHYTADQNLEGIALFIDFEKAFDSLEWVYLDKALDAFNFGLDFKRFATYVHGGGITTFAISKHGDRLASMMCSGTVKQLNVKIWDTTSTGAGEKPLPYGRSITALEFSHDGTKLAVIVENCDYVPVLETESGKIITTIEKLYADRFFSNVCFSPDDSQVLISRGQDKNVVIFSVADGQKVDEFKNVYEYEVGRACFSPQGQLAIMGIDQKYRPCSIKIFTFPEKRLIREFEKVDRLMTPCLYFTQDGSKLCAVRRDWEDDSTTVVVLCMKTGNVLQSINPGKYKIEQFCLDVSCTKCIIGLEREICVCDLESGKLLFQFKPQSGIINAIDSFRMDGQDYIVSGSDDKSLKVLDMNTGLQLGQMTCPYRVSAVASVTIPGSSRSYVAVGDQWTFLRILQWM
ncbi:hypothetical protein ACROYT_G027178 [Oculina patagonica]